jgi:hypothetical protein
MTQYELTMFVFLLNLFKTDEMGLGKTVQVRLETQLVAESFEVALMLVFFRWCLF